MSYFGAARRQAAKPSERRGFRPKRRQTGGGGRSPRTGGLRGWFAAVDWDRFRFRMVAVLFCVIWAALWARAGYIQLWNGAQLAERARRQHTSAKHVETPRGMILDRNGQILARSVEVRSVYANPGQVENVDATAGKLAGLLGRPAADIRAALRKGRGFVWIMRRVDDATAEAVRAADLPGVGLVREYERMYPYKQVAGQLLGFVGVDGKGLEGLERSFDDDLSGLSVRQVVQRDASGRRFYVKSGEHAPEAADLRLTLDVQIQFIAEEVLARGVEDVGAKWGGIVVVDVESGEVLAWAQYPFFNPNAYRSYKPGEYRNRLALDALEPGSTFKPFLVASALQEGTVTRDTIFYCENGIWRTKKIVIRDDNRAYKDLSVSQILVHSSNIGCGKIGLELGAVKFHRYPSLLGFGQRTGLHVNESKGILRAPRDWSEADLISASFGQSLSVTQAQMAQAYLTLANGGAYKPLRLVLSDAEAGDGGGQRVFSVQTAREVLKMMQEVVDSGTGRRAAVPGISVAGKTGTAQKADKSAYGEERTASFVGLAPAANPRYLVLIVLDEPSKSKYGGTIAAPLFKEVITRVMAYQGALPDPGAAIAQQAKRREERAAKAEARARARRQRKEETVLGEVRRELAAVATTITPKEKGAVPDVVGQSVRRAVEMFARQGLVPVIKGEGARVVRQEPNPGVRWTGKEHAPRECVLWLSEN